MSFNEWEDTKLSEICEFQKGYAFKSKDYQNKGRKIVKVSDLNNYSVNCKDCICIDEEKAYDYLKYTLETDDIIITTVGSWPQNPNSVVGKVIIVQKEATGSLLNQNAVRLRVKENGNQRFIFYALKNKDFYDYIIGTAQGAANQASITQSDIKKYTIKLPTIKTQNIIANTLSCLDEKIELNDKINKNLEEMAQTIYKSWFVDYEPFQDGEFEESELGPIPRDWIIIKLVDEVNFERGIEPGSRNYLNNLEVDCIPFYRVGDMLDKTNTYVKIDQIKDKILNEQDIAVSFDGTPGRVVSGLYGSYSTGIRKIFSKKRLNLSNAFLYFLMKSENIQEIMKKYSEGTTILHASNSIKFMQIAYDEVSIRRFNDIISPIFRLIINNKKTINKLINIRDSLLPKLMSGEKRLPLEKENE